MLSVLLLPESDKIRGQIMGNCSFSRFHPRKRQYPCILGRSLRFSSPPDAIGFTLAKKVIK